MNMNFLVIVNIVCVASWKCMRLCLSTLVEMVGSVKWSEIRSRLESWRPEAG